MKIAYFDCFSGISGDMILGALLDAGLELSVLEEELKKVQVSGYELSLKDVQKKGIRGKKLDVIIHNEKAFPRLEQIISLIDSSSLDHDIKEKCVKVFSKLADVEAKVHGSGHAHFHELGDLDSIVDIIGGIAGIKRLGIEKVYSSRIPLGNGFIKCSHGILPVPAPATIELLKGIPLYKTDIEGELVTPTGAAIISTLSSGFGVMPDMNIKSIGYGAGTSEYSIPNLLRIFIGETFKDELEGEIETVMTIETNIDDMNPQVYEYLIDKLLQAGALDVYLTPVIMKKSRPGTLLSIICSGDKFHSLARIIFDETTTLGVRFNEIKRNKLDREVMRLSTSMGDVNFKISKLKDRIINIVPEYEDCRKIALEKSIPINIVMDTLKNEGKTKFKL